jgi:acylglycerol lipase
MIYKESYLNDEQKFRFFVREWAPDTTPKGIVLLLHGLSDHGDRFRFVAESLVNKGFIFVASDLRGNGKSDGKRGHFDSLDQIMNDIHFLLQESKKQHPGLPVILYSQSMGGNLAINFTLRFPEEIICTVASSPWLRLTKPPSDLIQKFAALLVKNFPTLLIPNGLKSGDLCHDNVISHAYDKDPLIHWKVSLSSFFIIKNAGEWAIKNASSLKTPLLLLHSKADPITSFTASEEFYKNSNSLLTFQTYNDQFHELHNESIKEEVMAEIGDWITSKTS